jgi:hypothetical protein
MKTVKIHQFDPVIYPRKVWVCLGATKEVLDDRFTFNSPLVDELFTSIAVTSTCTEKETGSGGVIVWTPKRNMNINTIAHESDHVADMLFDFIGESTNTDECHAYLVGWVAECIEKAMKYKGI